MVKVGSNVLTTSTGKLDITRMSALVDQIAWLRSNGYEVILVSSGAVACGRKELQVDHELDSVEQRQLYSAIGQIKLIHQYYDLFREYNIAIGQVLTMKEHFEEGEQYNNQRACMEVMLQNGVLPVVNENDTVCVTEQLIRIVRPEDNLDKYIQTSKSSAGRGGMESKYHTARTVAQSGIRVIIANGERDNILADLIRDPENTVHTEFIV